jgi:hypothetical protein
MLSSEIEFWRQRNRLSVLLALLRSKLSSVQSRCLLRIQLAADQVAGQKQFPENFTKEWVIQVSIQIEKLFQELEAGAFRQHSLDRLVHLYRHLFVGHFTESEIERPQH